jgi:transcriptional regulator with XRE-family HTH domain
MHPKEAFGLTVKRLRKERHKPQESIAHDAGLSLTSLARIETGKQEARFGTILRLAAALGIGSADLMAEAERTLKRSPARRQSRS